MLNTLLNNEVKVGIIGDKYFEDYDLFEKILLQSNPTHLVCGSEGRFESYVDKFKRRYSCSSVLLADVDLVVVFYGGIDTSLIGRMKKAKKLGKKIKLVKYNFL